MIQKNSEEQEDTCSKMGPCNSEFAGPNKVMRVFSLESILDYCENNTIKEHAMEIVSMVNHLLLEAGDATNEEKGMVKITVGHLIHPQVCNTFNIGTYNERVNSQNNNYPSPEIKQFSNPEKDLLV